MTVNLVVPPPRLAPEPKVFRSTMSAFATGVAVLTTNWEGRHHGMTVNSLTSVSLDPCLILVCIVRGSATGQAILSRGSFALSLLTHEQQEVSRRFIGAVPDRFDGLDIHLSEEGLPLISGALAHLCCSVRDIHESGDHDILVGQVRFCEAAHGEPLVFYRGAFGRFHPPYANTL